VLNFSIFDFSRPATEPKSSNIFRTLQYKLWLRGPQWAKTIDTILLFSVNEEVPYLTIVKNWTVDLKKGVIQRESSKEPEITVGIIFQVENFNVQVVSNRDLIHLVTGETTLAKCLSSNKIKITSSVKTFEESKELLLSLFEVIKSSFCLFNVPRK
jgi:hypothetical protein